MVAHVFPKSIVARWVMFMLTAAGCYNTVVAQTYTVETVPNQKVIANHLVSNPDGIIQPETENSLNQVLDSLERKTSSQVAVVLLNSIGDESEFDFAQQLFDRWGIGQSSNDNGLLILFVADKRVIRFHTGYGLEGMLPDVICKRIQMQKMVPHFKEGDVDAGITAGVQEVIKILTNPDYAEEIKTEEIPQPIEWKEEDWMGVGVLFLFPWVIIFTIVYFVKRKAGFADSVEGPGENTMNALLKKSQWVWSYVVLPPVVVIALSLAGNGWVLLIGLYAYLALLVLAKYGRLQQQTNRFLKNEEYHSLYQFYADNKSFWISMAVLFPLPILFLLADYSRRQKSFRMHPRKCKNCSHFLTLLDDASEDKFLQKSMLMEEDLKSVDYDVWHCSECENISIEVYLNRNSEFTTCPKCNTIAFHEVGRRTLVAATTSSSGKREITKGCKYCQFTKVEHETIPRIVTSSSSGGSSRSGGSFGGGRSGGGGASSSW